MNGKWKLKMNGKRNEKMVDDDDDDEDDDDDDKMVDGWENDVKNGG